MDAKLKTGLLAVVIVLVLLVLGVALALAPSLAGRGGGVASPGVAALTAEQRLVWDKVRQKGRADSAGCYYLVRYQPGLRPGEQWEGCTVYGLRPVPPWGPEDHSPDGFEWSSGGLPRAAVLEKYVAALAANQLANNPHVTAVVVLDLYGPPDPAVREWYWSVSGGKTQHGKTAPDDALARSLAAYLLRVQRDP